MNKAKPILEKFDGWKTPLKAVKSYAKLPQNAKNYIEFIEDFCGTPVTIISVGYEIEFQNVMENPNIRK